MTVEREIAKLQKMTVGELRTRWQELYGAPARSRNRIFLWRRLAWRVQELAYGGLSERAKRRAEELACDADLRQRPPRGFAPESLTGTGTTVARPFDGGARRRLPQPGSTLVREFRGRKESVLVLENGFEHGGKIYRTLSAVAKAITGTHWNGFAFFRVDEGAGR